jgi:hypothetical protein
VNLDRHLSQAVATGYSTVLAEHTSLHGQCTGCTPHWLWGAPLWPCRAYLVAARWCSAHGSESGSLAPMASATATGSAPA